jgi:hypothetical protein
LKEKSQIITSQVIRGEKTMNGSTTLRALNDQVRNLFRDMVRGLSDEQVRYSAAAMDERSIGGVVAHGYGSVVVFAKILMGEEGKWSDVPAAPETLVGVLELVEGTHDELDELLREMPEEILEKKHMMSWGRELTGVEALTGGIAHGMAHAGGIQGIRAIGGFPTPAEQWG